MELIPLAILLEERKRNNHLFIELARRVDELENRLEISSSDAGFLVEP
jgi:hypothetical protein